MACAGLMSDKVGIEKYQEGHGIGAVHEDRVQSGFRRELQDEKMGEIIMKIR